MLDTTCAHCETPMTARNRSQNYCSKACRDGARLDRRSPIAAVSCQECGGQIDGRRRHALWCSVRCNTRFRQRQRRLAARAGLSCRNCGDRFDGSRKDQSFCSIGCRNRFHHLAREYGMTSAEFDARLDQQGRACAVCRVTDPDGWHIDHDHVTGDVRGVLCPDCNKMLGYARDNPSVLASAIAYLNR